MPAKSPQERSLVSRIGAYEKWANAADRSAATEPARKAFDKRFEKYPDPEAARKAYFTRLAFLSAKARARKKAGGDEAAESSERQVLAEIAATNGGAS